MSKVASAKHIEEGHVTIRCWDEKKRTSGRPRAGLRFYGRDSGGKRPLNSAGDFEVEKSRQGPAGQIEKEKEKGKEQFFVTGSRLSVSLC